MMSHSLSPTNRSSSPLQQPGALLLISCYELGHQPIGLAQTVGFLEQKGYAPSTLDLAVEGVDEPRIEQASMVGISVPMHTALSLGCQVAERIRRTNPIAHICFYGLYASLNAKFLLEHLADSVIGGEYETPLVNLVEELAKHQASGTSRSGTSQAFVTQVEGVSSAGWSQTVGFLEQKGYAPSTLDLAVEGVDEPRIEQASMVGISVPMHTALSLGCQVAERIRRTNPIAHICFYGLYASLNAKFLLEHLADSVIGGEYETPLVNLVEELAKHQASGTSRSGTSQAFVTQVEGVSSAGSIVPPFLKRIRWQSSAFTQDTSNSDSFPIPTRTALPSLCEYARLEYQGQERVVGYVEASRGCLHTCLHCPIVPVYQGRLFLVPEQVVLADIRQQVNAGAAHITLGDPDFLNGPRHSLNIVRKMHEEFPHITFDFTTKIEHILKHQSLFKEFRQLGCLFVWGWGMDQMAIQCFHTGHV